MNPKLLLGWALSASALALVFLGYAIGKRSQPEERAAAPASYGSHLADTSAGEPGEEPVDPYVVPDSLAGLPAEWRSAVDGEDFSGYAILFDLERREVIVEQCRHPGYFDDRTGREIPDGWELCNGVLWGTLTHIDEQSATAIDRSGRPVELQLSVDHAGATPTMTLSFESHDLALVPGSKNDFLQALENSPEMLRQKDKVLQNLVAKEQAQRRLAQEAGDGGEVYDVPTYAMPVSEDARGDSDK